MGAADQQWALTAQPAIDRHPLTGHQHFGLHPQREAWSIVSIFLFWPTGIPAIINATKVDPAWQMGNAAMAQEHSNKAKMFSMIGTIIGAVGFVIYFIIGWRFGLSLFGSE